MKVNWKNVKKDMPTTIIINLPGIFYLILWAVVIASGIKILNEIMLLENDGVKMMCILVWAVLMLSIRLTPRLITDKIWGCLEK